MYYTVNEDTCPEETFYGGEYPYLVAMTLLFDETEADFLPHKEIPPPMAFSDRKKPLQCGIAQFSKL